MREPIAEKFSNADFPPRVVTMLRRKSVTMARPLLLPLPVNPNTIPPLPAALPGDRREINGAAGRVSFYVGGTQHGGTPMLLIHSINASASAYEVRPIYEYYRKTRPVYAIDLPGYGFSDRSDREYLPRLMTDGVLALAGEIRRVHGDAAIDILGVSLATEYAARAAMEMPDWFRSVALISPTGFNRDKPFDGPPGSTRGIERLRKILSNPSWSDGLFRNLTRPGVVRYFLNKTWGSKRIDEGLLEYDLVTTKQPGAKHAPLYFLSAYLFSADISRVYQSLTMPVWMVHGVRGDFVDYRYKKEVERKPNWRITVMQTGALPYFEIPQEFSAAYDAFLAEAAAVAEPAA